LAGARAALADASTTPSARVLAAMAKDFDNSFLGFTLAQSQKTQTQLLARPFPPEMAAHFRELARASIEEQQAIEAADTMPFEHYRQQYLSPKRLGL
jgi:glutamate--cysteine ligase